MLIPKKKKEKLGLDTLPLLQMATPPSHLMPPPSKMPSSLVFSSWSSEPSSFLCLESTWEKKLDTVKVTVTKHLDTKNLHTKNQPQAMELDMPRDRCCNKLDHSCLN